MAVEANAIKIENFPLLKFGAAPDRRERWQTRTLPAIRGAHPNDDRTMFMGHRVQVINGFEITGDFFLARLIDLLLDAVDDGFDLGGFLHRAIEPIHTGCV